MPEPKRRDAHLARQEWRDLRPLTDDHLQILAERYSLSVPALREAVDRGLLHLGQAGRDPVLVVTDSRRYTRQDMRLDGRKIRLKNGDGAPKRTLGRPTWAVGLDRANQWDQWLVVEGNTDLLAAFEILSRMDELNRWGVCAFFGAGIAGNPHETVIASLTRKRVVLAFDADEAGDKATHYLGRRLIVSRCQVERLDLPRGTDLRDILTTQSSHYDQKGEVPV